MGYSECSKLVSEFIGTAVLMAAFTNVTVNGNALGALAVASALMIMVYALGSVSGANFNPAVSIALAVMSCLGFKGIDFPCGACVKYICMQLLGAAVGALLSTWLWLPHPFESSSTAGDSDGVLAGNSTLPWANAVIEGKAFDKGDFSVLGSETLYTFVLVFVVLNTATQGDPGKLGKDEIENREDLGKPVKNNYFGLAIGFVIVAGATAVGGISGCCLNPAVSFGATLMNLLYAKVDNTVNAIGYWFGYSAMEILGALLACVCFLICRSDKSKGKPVGLLSKFVAEFLGTFVLCMTVQFVVNAAPSPIGAVGIAASLMVMIYALGKVSGANFNPAVSIALLLNGDITCVDFVVYVIAQLAGALFAVFVVWLVVGKLVVALVVKHGQGIVAGAAGGDWFAIVIAELLFTTMLVFTVLNVATPEGDGGGNGNQYYGLAIGFVVIVGAASVGSISGGCFNPAVAVSLDCAAWWAGTGAEWGWSWVYFLTQLAAGVLAVGLFKLVRCEDGVRRETAKDLDSEEEEEEEEEADE
jgi:aquaporin Z